jgi:hypothetical protein
VSQALPCLGSNARAGSSIHEETEAVIRAVHYILILMDIQSTVGGLEALKQVVAMVVETR